MARYGALVERTHEMAELRAALGSIGTDGRLLLIEGPAGIGKSRLIEQLRQEASAFEVLSARAGLLERDIAFGVARQLFERRMAQAPADEQDALLAGAAAAAGPVLATANDETSPVPSELGRSLHGLFWLVDNLAQRCRLLLTVDDVQWCDGASLHFLAYLARRLDGVPVLIAVAARDDEPWPDEAARAELVAVSTTIRPAPLSVDGVGQLVELAFGAIAPEDLVEACRVATGGNPFYLGELLATVAGPGGDPAAVPVDAVRATVPTTVARSILLRLGRLGESATSLATAAAVLGDGASLRQAAALAGLTGEDADRAADLLVRASILASIEPIRFAHPIVLAALTGDVPPARRAALHRQAARLLHEDGSPLDRLVPHLLRATATGDPWLVATLQRAAAEAAARGAPDAVVRCLRRALDEPPAAGRAGILTALAGAELAAGAYRECVATAERAIEAAPDGTARAQVRLPQAYALMSVEGIRSALRCLEQGIDDAADANPELSLVLQGELAAASWMADMAHAAVAGLQLYRDRPGATYGERYVLGVLALEALRQNEPASEVLELALRSWSDGALIAENPTTFAYYAVMISLLGAEANEGARRISAEGLALTQTHGLVYGYAGMCWMRGLLALAEGDLVSAEADERACVEHAVPTMIGIGIASLALVLLEQGDVDGAFRELEGGGLLTDERPLYVWGPYVRGLVQLARGRAAEALADLRDVGRHAVEVGGYPAALPWRASAALAADATGDRAEAERLAAEEVERARRHGGSRTLGVALRTVALLASGQERVDHLTASVAALELTPARLDLAKARFDLGLALLRAGRRREGRDQLERSYDGAQKCGARGLAQAAYDELLVAGARPRRLTFTGVESLTASERRVAAMAAEGMTNRDIAQALFVTPKTVENQLGRVYSKLGVSSRRELREVLAPAN